jgi:predicted nucleotidyltransferase
VSASGISSGPALTEQEKTIIRDILHANLPKGIAVYVFGSRARGKCKPYSDLDLALEAEYPLSLEIIARLSEAFDESELPWKVDLVDRHMVSDDFRKLIDGSKVVLE